MEEDPDCFVIPFEGDTTTDYDIDAADIEIPALKPSLDLPDGPRLRSLAYRQVWDRVYQRSQEIVRRFHSKLAEQLRAFVDEQEDVVADEDEDEDDFGLGSKFGLGYEGGLLKPVLKTAVVLGGSTTIFEDLGVRDGPTAGSRPYVTQLSAKDCGNLSSAMKCLIAGFVGRPNDEDGEDGAASSRPKRSNGTTLAPNDVNLLEAWYKTVKTRHEGSSLPNLIVIVPDVEAVNPTLLEDLLYICSLHARTVPLVFVLSVSTSPDYLQRTLSHSAMTCLDVTYFEAVGSEKLCSEVIEGLFFDPAFEPGIMFTPSVLQTIIEVSETQLGSVDGLLSAIQLVLLNHCCRPFSVFLTDKGPDPLTTSEAFQHRLLITLTQQMDKYEAKTNPAGDESWIETQQNVTSEDAASLIKVVDAFRDLFSVHTKMLRKGVRLIRLLQGGDPSNPRTLGPVEVLAMIEREGELEKLFKAVVSRVKKHSVTDLEKVLQDVQHTVEDGLGEGDAMEETLLEDVLAALAKVRTEADQPAVNSATPSPSKKARIDLSTIDGVMAMASAAGTGAGRSRYAEEIGEIFDAYLREMIMPLDLVPLHEVWYVRSQTAKSVNEILNPSVYSSITSALARPQAYLQCICCTNVRSTAEAEDGEGSMTTLPDESVAFLRYLNSGKSVNVYDWFETFFMGLESDAASPPPPPPRGSKGKGKAKQREEKTEEEEEEERQRLQARFLRCFHEFDLLGLLKQTGRKQDHVQRTVYEMED